MEREREGGREEGRCDARQWPWRWRGLGSCGGEGEGGREKGLGFHAGVADPVTSPFILVRGK